MPDQESPQDTLQRLEAYLDELSNGLDKLDKEVRAVLKQCGKRSSASPESETPPCDAPADAATSGTAS